VTIYVATKPDRASDGEFLSENVVEVATLTDAEIQAGVWTDVEQLDPCGRPPHPTACSSCPGRLTVKTRGLAATTTFTWFVDGAKVAGRTVRVR
jgi:hypothetical protein